MLISVHLPKTAGTSFAAALEDHFGTKMLKDYNDLPINTPPFERNQTALKAAIENAEKDFSDIECIHGHFLPIKYLLLATKKDVTFITWLRHPVERVLSHYFYWQRNYNPQRAPQLHRKVIEENWSLERFCLGPEVKDLYSQFLWGFPIDYFDFIGITEYFEEDFKYFSKNYLNTELEQKKLNVGDNNKNKIDFTLWKKIEAHHSRDMELYRWALKKRKERFNK